VGEALEEVAAADHPSAGTQAEMLAERPNIMATLQNLGTDIELDAAQGGFSPAGLTTLTNDIDEDIASELNDIGLGGTTAAPYYIGGHFNLDIPILQLIIPGAFSQADVDKFERVFAGAGLASDGVRQPAVHSQALALGYFLHSQEGKPKDPSNYSFHFDRFGLRRRSRRLRRFGWSLGTSLPGPGMALKQHAWAISLVLGTLVGDPLAYAGKLLKVWEVDLKRVVQRKDGNPDFPVFAFRFLLMAGS